jgi:hypothetical protein
MADPRMEGIITIRLRAHDLSQSKLPDVSYDADWLRREIPKLTYTDKKTGEKSNPIPDKGYEIIECAATVRPEA